MTKLTIFRALILASGLGLATASSAVPIAYNGHLYELTTSDTWTGAEAQAVLKPGGHLVTVNDGLEQAFLVTAFGGAERLWIGFTDQTLEGALNFVWISGQAVTYTNWAGSEPNDSGGEDYTAMNWSAPGNWNDCNNNACAANGTFRGIIEYVPEPAGIALLGLGLLGLAATRRRVVKT